MFNDGWQEVDTDNDPCNVSFAKISNPNPSTQALVARFSSPPRNYPPLPPGPPPYSALSSMQVQSASRCNSLLFVEIIAICIYGAQLGFVIADLIYDVSRTDDASGLSPLAMLILSSVGLGFCLIWALVFFCFYEFNTHHKKAMHSRHYLAYHRHLRSFVAYSLVLFLLSVFFYIQYQHLDNSIVFSLRYSDTCRQQPSLIPAACPVLQTLLFWNLLRACVLFFLFVEVGNFHDSYSHHRFPQLLKQYPDEPSRFINTRG